MGGGEVTYNELEGSTSRFSYMLQKNGFFQRDTQSGSHVGLTTYMSRFFFLIFKSFIEVCTINTVFFLPSGWHV